MHFSACVMGRCNSSPGEVAGEHELLVDLGSWGGSLGGKKPDRGKTRPCAESCSGGWPVSGEGGKDLLGRKLGALHFIGKVTGAIK